MKSKLTALAKVAVIAGIALTATSALANPPWVRVRSISYAGSGCPAGTVAENLSPDFLAFTLLFDSYVAEAGPGIPLSASRKNCQILVDFDFPQGWSYTILDVDYRGYVALDASVVGTQKSTYYFQGSSTSAPLQTNFTGPRNGDYHIRDTLGVTALVWSPCGAQRAININTQVRVDNARNRNGRGLMTLDSIDGQLRHIYGVRWRRC